jgi:hypothetical protein
MIRWDSRKNTSFNDTPGAKTDDYLFAKQSGYPDRQTLWSPTFDRSFQPVGTQDGRCPHPGRDYRREAVWECGQTQSSETSVSRTNKAITSELSARPRASRVSKEGCLVAIAGRVVARMEDLAGAPTPSSPRVILKCDRCVCGLFTHTV